MKKKLTNAIVFSTSIVCLSLLLFGFFSFRKIKQSDVSPLEYQTHILTHFSSIHLKSSYALYIHLNLCLSKSDSFVSVLLGLLKLLQ